MIAAAVERVARAIMEATRRFDQDGYDRRPKPGDATWRNRTEMQKIALCRVAQAAIDAMTPKE